VLEGSIIANYRKSPRYTGEILEIYMGDLGISFSCLSNKIRGSHQILFV
jgi:hypothetical protein